MSSAPKVEEFTPPEPTPQDEYPGYYKLPSGDWAAYDPAYYKKFYDKWKKEYDAHVRALEKGTKGFEVNAAAEMERAKVEIKEREERKALTTGDTGGEPAKPRMNIQVCISHSVSLDVA
jgi:proline-rich protein PRCC